MPRTPQPSPGPAAAVAGLILAATSALPLGVDEISPLRALLRVFAESWVDGLVALLIFGSPYLLGACVALAILMRSGLTFALLRVPVTVLYAELVLLALMLVKDPGDAVAPWGLIGFVAAATLGGVARFANDAKRGRAPSLAWTGRWGALLVVGLLGWLLLQVLVHGDASLVFGPWATLAAAALLVVTCRPVARSA